MMRTTAPATMREEDQNLPDDFWRKAFEEASEPPPARVWDAVERRLDESKDTRILPLWAMGLVASRPFAWGIGMAATVALLLLGWWSIKTSPSGDLVAQRPVQPERTGPATPEKPSLTSGNSSSYTAERHTARPVEAEAVAVTNKPVEKQPEKGNGRNNRIELPLAEQNQLATSPFSPAKPGMVTEPKTMTTLLTTVPTTGQLVISSSVDDVSQPVGQPPVSVTFPLTPTALVVSSNMDQTTLSMINELAMRPIQLREPGQIQRIVWVQPAELPVGPDAAEPVMVQSKREPKAVWASVSMMPGAFIPSVSVRSAQTSVSNAFVLTNTRTNQPTVDSRASLSVAYQAGAGVQLTDHWSIESGVGYLVGHSTVSSPAGSAATIAQVSISNQNTVVSSLFTDALRNSVNRGVAGNKAASADLIGNSSPQYQARATYSTQTRQTLTNDYQYIQLPLQVGYQIRPRKRLSLALLGGLLTNIFVRNTVGDELLITSRDGVYRPLSWAATMGARFRYRPSRRWSASLAGIYQPALGSGTRPASEVTSRPTSTGMSFGVDYHF